MKRLFLAATFVTVIHLFTDILVAQPTDSVTVSFIPVAVTNPLASVGGVLHGDDCDSVRILSLVFTWDRHPPIPPYQVPNLDWSAGRGQDVPQTFELPPGVPFPDDVHVVYVLYPDGTPHNLNIDTLVPGRSYALAPGCPRVPVQLSSFTGTVINNRVRLDWTTVSEINNYGFHVQKSNARNGIFETIPHSFIPGHGTTLEPHHYSFLDTAARAELMYYRLKQIDLDGTLHFTDAIHILLTAAGGLNMPGEFALHQNYPNPFNPITTLRFDVAAKTHVTLKVYNVLGQEVRTIVDGVREPGFHSATFDASSVSSGVYYYQLVAGDFVAVRTMVVIR